MTWIALSLPLMLVAIAIATVPVLYHSLREGRLGPAAEPVGAMRPGVAHPVAATTREHREPPMAA